jgi:hypothetical protein
MAAARAIAAARRGEPEVLSLQEVHAHLKQPAHGRQTAPEHAKVP